LRGLRGTPCLLGDWLVIAPQRGARMGSTDLCDRVAKNLCRYPRPAGFAQVGAAAFADAVVPGAVTRGLEIFECSMTRKKIVNALSSV
jgi:hypothetical protein